MFSIEFCEISKNTFFTGHLLTTASYGKIFFNFLRVVFSSSEQTESLVKIVIHMLYPQYFYFLYF